MFFQGSTEEAVLASKTGGKALVVFLAGQDHGSKAAELERRFSHNDAQLSGHCVVLKLEDDLSNTNPEQFPDAKAFRRFCPTDALPMMVVVSPAGTIVAVLRGEQLSQQDTCSLHAALADALCKVRQEQVQNLMPALVVAAAQGLAAVQQVALRRLRYIGARMVKAVRRQAAGAAAAQQQQQQQQDVSFEEGGDDAEGGEELLETAVDLTSVLLALLRRVIDSDEVGSEGSASEEEQPAAGQMVEDSQVCALQVRFPWGGTPLALQLPGFSQLAEVFAAVDAHIASQGKDQPPYILATLRPRRLFAPAEQSQTLRLLRLPAQATLMVLPAANPRHGHRPAARALATPAVPAEPAAGTAGPAAEVAQGAVPAQSVAAGGPVAAASAAAAAVPASLAEPAGPAVTADGSPASASSRAAGSSGAAESLPQLPQASYTASARGGSGGSRVAIDNFRQAAASAAAARARKAAGSRLQALSSAAGAASGRDSTGRRRRPIEVNVYLKDTVVLRKWFDGHHTTLAQVLDYMDAHRTDGSSGPYRVTIQGARRTLSVSHLDRTLDSLVADIHLPLCLMPLPPAPWRPVVVHRPAVAQVALARGGARLPAAGTAGQLGQGLAMAQGYLSGGWRLNGVVLLGVVFGAALIAARWWPGGKPTKSKKTATAKAVEGRVT
ncbi:hypothetical protein N2152v2_008642 [Parachlorella kessleri]